MGANVNVVKIGNNNCQIFVVIADDDEINYVDVVDEVEHYEANYESTYFWARLSCLFSGR